MLQLTSKQIAELKAYLGTYGLDVRPVPKPRKAKCALTVQQVLAKSKWYKPPRLASLGKPYGRFMRFVETNYRFDKATGTYEAVK